MASYEAPPLPPIAPPGFPPLGVTQDEAIALLKSQKIFKRAIHAGWIEPVIQGGLGRTSVFDYGDLLKLWERLRRKEFPPKLPSETKGIRRFFAGLLEFFTEPTYTLPPREDIERAMAAAFQKERAKREEELDQVEKKKAENARPELLKEEEQLPVQIDVEL